MHNGIHNLTELIEYLAEEYSIDKTNIVIN